MLEAAETITNTIMPPFPADVAQLPNAVPTKIDEVAVDSAEYTTKQGEDVRTLPLGQIGMRLEALQEYLRDLYSDINFYNAELLRRSDAENKAKVLPDPQFLIEVTRGTTWKIAHEGCVEFIRECNRLGVPKPELKVAISIKATYLTKKNSADALAKKYGGELKAIVGRAFVGEEDKPRVKCVRKKNA